MKTGFLRAIVRPSRPPEPSIRCSRSAPVEMEVALVRPTTSGSALVDRAEAASHHTPRFPDRRSARQLSCLLAINCREA